MEESTERYYDALYDCIKRIGNESTTVEALESKLTLQAIFKGIIASTAGGSVSYSDLEYAKNDADADTKGVDVGGAYLTSSDNSFGLKEGILTIRIS